MTKEQVLIGIGIMFAVACVHYLGRILDVLLGCRKALEDIQRIGRRHEDKYL